MRKRVMYCMNCGKRVIIKKDDEKITCPCCKETYVVDELTDEPSPYDHIKIRVREDYIDETVEELKLFHYEYVSKEPDEAYTVWINLKRLKKFKYKNNIVKIENENKRLREEVNKLYYEIDNIPHGGFFGFGFFLFPVLFASIVILSHIDMPGLNNTESHLYLQFFISILLGIGFNFLISKLIQKIKMSIKISNKKEQLKEVLNRQNELFKELEEVNKKIAKK